MLENIKKMKWRLAMRIASHPESRWTKKTATWNQGLSIGAKAGSRVKRWEDDINQFLKPEETEETKGNDLKNNDVKDRKNEKKCKKITNTARLHDIRRSPHH